MQMIFKYEDEQHQFNEVRSFNIDGEAWFVAADVCKVLGIKNARDVVSRLNQADVGNTDIRSNGQMRNMKIVNESGFYVLVFQSKKPEAERFKRWVTKEVLPTIRKTGGYGRQHTPIFVRR